MNECSAEWLKDSLRLDTVLVLDCRLQVDYQMAHITSSMNVNLPPLLQRRLKKGNLTVATTIQNNEKKELFAKECKFKDIVLYDSTSCDSNANTSSVLSLLYAKLVQDGCKVQILKGMCLA